jgi:hypothetical protein
VTAAAQITAPLFHSPRGAYPWQVEGAVEAYVRGSMLAAWSAGTGKSVLATLTACLLFADGEIDTCVVLAESTKVLDYVEDFARFTDLRAADYTGPPARRAKALGARPQVLVTTYETARNDICTFASNSWRVTSPGPLAEHLMGRRVLIVMDETTKLANRSSALYQSVRWLLAQLRKRTGLAAGHVRVLQTTATTVTRTPESHFNLARLLDPKLAGTVTQFEADHVGAWHPDRKGVVTAWKNLTAADCAAGVTPLAEKLAPLIHRVRKSDSAIAPNFPVLDERPPTLVSLSDRHYALLQAIVARFRDVDDSDRGALYGVLRQAAGYPESLLVGGGAMAQEVARVVGAAGLRRIGSAKRDALLAWGAGLGSRQGVAFTFYGQSTLPLLQRDLAAAGLSVAANHGGLSQPARQRAKAAFLAGDVQVYLSSDAGSKGISLGSAAALTHFEPPTTYERLLQRSNRVHRVDSIPDRVTVDCLVADATLDVPALRQVHKRNEWQDGLLDDPDGDGISAADRKRMFREVYDLR